jgi:iron uptake system component EfeO
MTCGLLGNPRGRLHVSPSEQTAAAASRPLPRAYIGPLAEYRVYLMLEAGKLASEVDSLAQAIAQGNLPLSKALYISAHRAYLHSEPVVALFADLDKRINARAEDFERRGRDPSFAGFHRIESALFAKESLDGVEPVAKQLVADVGTLRARLRALKTRPEWLARCAAHSTQKLVEAIVNGRSAHGAVVLSDARGSVEGVVEIVDLLRPLLAKADAALQTRIDADVKGVQVELDRIQTGPAMGQGANHAENRQPLIERLKALGADLEAVNTGLGLD